MIFLLCSSFLTYSIGSRWRAFQWFSLLQAGPGGRGNQISSGSWQALCGPWIFCFRISLLSCFPVIGFNGLAVEEQILRHRGLLDSDVPTLLKTRKSTSPKLWCHSCKAYFSWCKIRKFHPRKFLMGWILFFLQSGLDQHLALSTIKGQTPLLQFLFLKTASPCECLCIGCHSHCFSNTVPSDSAGYQPGSLTSLWTYQGYSSFYPYSQCCLSLHNNFYKASFWVVSLTCT